MRKANPFYGWMIVLGAIVFLALLAPISVSLTSLFATAVTEDTGISLSQFTLSNTLLQGVGILLAPLASRLLSTKYFKKIHIAMTALYGTAIAMLGFANHLYVFYLISCSLSACLAIILSIGSCYFSIMAAGLEFKSKVSD